MAILIANKLLETETEAWYTFYVDTLEDIKDLPTSKTTGSSYKVKKLAKPASSAILLHNFEHRNSFPDYSHATSVNLIFVRKSRNP